MTLSPQHLITSSQRQLLSAVQIGKCVIGSEGIAIMVARGVTTCYLAAEPAWTTLNSAGSTAKKTYE